MMIRSTRLRTTALALLLCAAPATAWAGFTFTKIADYGTTNPSGGGTFSFFGAPSFDGNTTAFLAANATDGGVYTSTGGVISIVADNGMAVPDGTGNFVNFLNDISIDGGKVAFQGLDEDGVWGVFTDVTSSLGKLVDTTDLIPGTTSTFNVFTNPSIRDGIVAVTGVSSTLLQSGLYTSNGGPLTTVADLTTPIPDGVGNFTRVGSPPATRQGKVAFIGLGSSGQTGVYTNLGGSLATVADLNTMQPDGSGDFEDFIGVRTDGTEIAFRGHSFTEDLSGIYVGSAGSLTTIVDTNTIVPGFATPFNAIGGIIAFDDGNVAFAGAGLMTPPGLFTTLGGSLQKVIIRGDMLGGKEVEFFTLGPDGLRGDSVAFLVQFTDASKAIYLASIPEPSTALLMLCGMVWLRPARRRRGAR